MNELELRAKNIFMAALDEAPQARGRMIDDACGDDEALRAEVRALFDAYEHSTQFLATPALESPVATAHRDGEWIGRQIGRFTIRSVLASGGMGVVYLADQEQPRRTVALKMLRSAMPTESAIRRFEYEAEVLGRLQHPNVAQIFEAGVCSQSGTSGTPYFALEFIDGSVDLIEHCRARKLNLRERLELFAKVCRAVHYAHQQGVIHRDLKPHNILVEQAHGEPKIIDFGIARASETDVSEAHTAAGQVLGTLQYSSPEQCAGGHGNGRLPIDTRTDVYALGAILYEMLADRPPFHFSDYGLVQVLRMIQEDEPERLGAIDASLRGDVETIVQKAMAKDRERRYESAAALADDLSRFLQFEPIAARPPSTIYQIKRFSQRNRALVGGMAASVLILIGGMVSVSFALAAEAKQRKLAETATTNAVIQQKKAEDARDLASEQRELANEMSEAAKAQSEMTARVLASASPWVSGGDTAEAILAALEASVAELDESWEGPPLNEAAIRLAAAKTFSGFGRAEQARANADRALEIFLEMLGEDHEYTVRTLVQLSAIADEQGRFNEAQDVLKRAMDALDRIEDPDPSIRVSILNSQCRTAIRIGDTAGAEELAREAMEVSRDARVSPAQRNTARLSLADALTHEQQYAEAEPLYHETLAIRQATLGERHPSTLVVQHNLAGLLIRSGRADEAKPHIEHVLKTRREIFGDAHTMTLIAMNDLANAQMSLGDLDQARTTAEEGVDLHVQHLGSRHPYTLIIRNTLAHIYLQQTEFERCAEQLTESLAITEAREGPTSNQALLLKHNLGVVYKRMGKPEEGIKLLRESADGRLRLYGANDARTRATQQQLAESLLELSEFDEARTVIDELLAGEAASNDFPWTPGLTRGSDAACLAAEGDLDGAAERYQEAITMVIEAAGSTSYRARHVVNAAVKFAEHYERPDDLARFRAYQD